MIIASSCCCGLDKNESICCGASDITDADGSLLSDLWGEEDIISGGCISRESIGYANKESLV